MRKPHAKRTPSDWIAKAFFRLLLPAGTSLKPAALRALDEWAAKEYPREDIETEGRRSSADGEWSLTLSPSEIVWNTRAYSLRGLREHAQPVVERLRPLFDAEISFQALLHFLVSVSLEHSSAERLLPFLDSAKWRGINESRWSLSGSFSRGHYDVRSVLHPAESHFVSSIEVIAESVASDDVDAVVSDLDQQGVHLLPDLAIEHFIPIQMDIVPMQQLPFLTDPELTARAELLARKHSGAPFSAEDEARLSALSERVRRLLPRVTRRDWENLAAIEARAEETEKLVAEIRQRHGLDLRG